MVPFNDALNTVKQKLIGASLDLKRETLPLREAVGRILAEEVAADRDYPPFDRSIRDGFAVRSADVASPPTELRVRGEVRAGAHFSGTLGMGDCVSIMTGAPMPKGADAVVMVEHTESHGDTVKIQRSAAEGENIVPRGSEVAAGTCILAVGRRIGAAELGLLATVGKSTVSVFARPVVAILSTGDEIVPVDRQPEWFQIRNSNATTLSVQVTSGGGVPHCLETVPDVREALRERVQEGLKADLFLLSGGVSAGKYDLVEEVLAEFGAEFYFQSVAVRPGRPLVFGRAQGKFFFGLPGNPVSTFVTFTLFARPAISVLGGGEFIPPMFLRARLQKRFRQNNGLTSFLPARISNSSGDPVVSLVGWQGSGDLVGLAEANCFLVIHPAQTDLAAGDWVDVMPKEP